MTQGLIIVGDVLDGLARLDDNSVDAVVTDPPYELAFMGKKWDATGVAFRQATWEACLRVLKPGGYLLAFGGTRTHHRLWCAVEDAGFEVRDTLMWLYGQGFPKSLDVSKAIDKAAGAEREVVSTSPSGGYKRLMITNKEADFRPSDYYPEGNKFTSKVPITDEAKQWEGWGTALKPAWEPILLARKPLEGTVAENVLAHGVGGLNIDATRIGTDEQLARSPSYAGSQIYAQDEWTKTHPSFGRGHEAGRWPANVIFECTCDDDAEGGHEPDCPAGMLDAQSGALGDTQRPNRVEGQQVSDSMFGRRTLSKTHGGSGGASRFFTTVRFRYVAKASRAERERGLEDFEPITGAEAVNRKPDTAGLKSPRAGAGRTAKQVKCGHPTVKPIALMRWLVRLVTPPGGIVVDPFCGSGSTLIAAREEGHDFVGVDLSAEYCRIAQARAGGAELVQAEAPEDTEPEWEE
ncbi:hypothetical protein LCGC14_0722820 [marine sediment metagenome]|uniref:DNA methylase N-4/N-6 domain-containing protein n=1 Tax=marine sediment metagenome TaxID=412755 RepID=A0A0F9TJ38_9ZZZZ